MPIHQRSIRGDTTNSIVPNGPNNVVKPNNTMIDSSKKNSQNACATETFEKISEIRNLIRQQTNMTLNVRHRSDSNSSDDLELPFRRFTPIPPIARSEDPYFRTESKLIKDDLINDEDDDQDVATPTPAQYKETQLVQNTLFSNADNASTVSNKARKETKYHFGSSNPPLAKDGYASNILMYSFGKKLLILDAFKSSSLSLILNKSFINDTSMLNSLDKMIFPINIIELNVRYKHFF
jgi:hypothetical protein